MKICEISWNLMYSRNLSDQPLKRWSLVYISLEELRYSFMHSVMHSLRSQIRARAKMHWGFLLNSNPTHCNFPNLWIYDYFLTVSDDSGIQVYNSSKNKTNCRCQLNMKSNYVYSEKLKSFKHSWNVHIYWTMRNSTVFGEKTHKFTWLRNRIISQRQNSLQPVFPLQFCSLPHHLTFDNRIKCRLLVNRLD